MHLWRNRQTRQIQVLVGATRCRFDSCQVHQKKAAKRLPFFIQSEGLVEIPRERVCNRRQAYVIIL